MKYWLLALLVALLSACGGGGGGGAVSLETQDDSAALMSQLGEARTEIVASIPADRQAEFERKIAALEQDLNAARASVAELSAQLTAILEEMRNIAIPPETPEPSPPNNTPTAADCHANLQVLVDGNCQNCEADKQFNPANNTCEPLPPTAAACHAKSQILVGDSCQNCEADKQFNPANNTCEPLPPTAAECHANLQVLVDGNCQSCEAGERFSINKCVAIPTAAECYDMQKILVGDNCQSCEAGERFSINKCVAIPTAAECYAMQKILVNDNCQSCEAGERFSINKCVAIPTAAECYDMQKILVDGNCQNCEADERFSINKCVAIPTAAECYDMQKILVGDNCQSCEADERFSINKCVAIPTAAECYDMQKILVGDNCQSCEADERFSINKCVAIPTAAECYDMQKILVGDNCQSCEADERFSINKCVAIPTAAECYDMQKILVGDNCQSCEADERFSINECVAIPTATECYDMQKILVGNNCESCEAGERFSINECVAIPTAAECYDMQKILVNSNCESCEAGERFSINKCVAIPAAEECHAEEKILVGDNCQSCEAYEQFHTATNTCKALPTAAECHANLQVLVDSNCKNCEAGEQFDTATNKCKALPTAEECHAEEKVLVGDSCRSCSANTQFVINRCVRVLSTFDTEEYRRNPMYEDIQPLYAYQKGYFGQGVTVAVIEARTGYVLDHPDLAPNYITATVNDIAVGVGIADSRVNSHASGVAGIIGAVRDGVGMHGIAPEVKMLPFSGSPFYYRDTPTPGSFERIPNLTVVLRYIRENNIPIVNNSRGSNLIQKSVSDILEDPEQQRNAALYNEYVGDTDSIWVWAAGNDRFHGSNFYSRSRAMIRPSPQSLYPLHQGSEDLEKNWVVAIALSPIDTFDANYNIYHEYRIANFSNACGPTKYFCVATAVYDTHIPSYKYESGYAHHGPVGTSDSAPQVSGALAILHGAIGIESPQMARAILLTTATDVGDPGVDEIYGRGIVNILKAMVMIENMKTATADGLSAVSFADLRSELPSGFSHLHNELSAVQVAIKLTNGLHYNVALSEMLTPGDAPDVPLGDGATDMLADAESDSRRGFFAYGDIDAELGLRYYGGTGGFSYVAEGQHAKTNQRFFSGNFGSLGGVSGKVYSGKVGFVRDMNMAGMQIFGDYERAAVGGDGDEGNLIVGVRDAQAESWMAGLSFADIWKYGDKIKLSARQEMGLSGGDLIVRYPHAVGDFHETFIGEGTQEIEVREAFLPLKQSALMIYTAGYAQQFTAKSEWAAALEYNAGNNAKAISLIWQGEF